MVISHAGKRRHNEGRGQGGEKEAPVNCNKRGDERIEQKVKRTDQLLCFLLPSSGKITSKMERGGAAQACVRANEDLELKFGEK